MNQIPQQPQILYAQTDPSNWDPFSRANRMACVHEYCVHPTTDDDALRLALDFMEQKVKSAHANDYQADEEVSTRDEHRNLFNYKYLRAPRKRARTETAKATKFTHISECLT